MMSFGLLEPASQLPVLLITRIRMCMLLHLTHEITFFIKTAIFQRVLMFLEIAFQLHGHCEAVICVMMPFGLFLTADQILRVTAVIMLVGFNPARGLALHCDRR